VTIAVVDASVAVKWFVPEEHSEVADRLAEADWILLAPKLILSEVANTFWSKIGRKLMTVEDGQEHLAALPRFFDHFVDDDDLLPSALSLASSFDHPIYDFIYLTAARRRGAVMVTADRRFVRLLQGSAYAQHVVHLTDWTPRVP
jgi:predicted nucleic acid-binding protein